MPHRNRDPESCDIQIRLPEVSKRQAKIVSDNKDKVTELHTRADPPLRPGRAVASNPPIAPPQVWLVNMSKTNPGGTILNSEPLQEDERRELNNNDVVQVCGVGLTGSGADSEITEGGGRWPKRARRSGGSGSVLRSGGDAEMTEAEADSLTPVSRERYLSRREAGETNARLPPGWAYVPKSETE